MDGGHNELPGHGTVAEDPLYAWKSPFLNIQFFVVRAIGIFAVFIGVATLLRKWSFDTDTTGDINNTQQGSSLVIAWPFLNCHCNDSWFNRLVQVIGIPLVLDYVWGLVFLRLYSCCLSFSCYFGCDPCLKGYLKGILKQAHRYDIACMMLAFTVFWAYISFSQYFLIYSANIPEETFWYNIREKNFDGGLNSGGG